MCWLRIVGVGNTWHFKDLHGGNVADSFSPTPAISLQNLFLGAFPYSPVFMACVRSLRLIFGVGFCYELRFPVRLFFNFLGSIFVLLLRRIADLVFGWSSEILLAAAGHVEGFGKAELVVSQEGWIGSGSEKVLLWFLVLARRIWNRSGGLYWLL